MEEIIKISVFVFNSFVHIWPYLLITIPLAVGVQLSGASRYINNALGKNPYASIFLATAVGAISPFCSCGVIPVITTLLIGGVPLAPVMSFWIASPSMDPEIFMLSVATIGWKLSVWRLTATFAISLLAGMITHYADKNGFFGDGILRTNCNAADDNSLKNLLPRIYRYLSGLFTPVILENKTVQYMAIKSSCNSGKGINCCVQTDSDLFRLEPSQERPEKSCNSYITAKYKDESFAIKLMKETWKAFAMVAKFMAIAFFINALIAFYLPANFLTKYLGWHSQLSVLIAAMVGIPFYTSNITALPMISGLLALGMNQGAALSFLIAGPVTTLPAMMAVWGIVKPKIFYMYLAFSFSGAVIFGYLYNFMN
jgi:hypothetical protein